MQGGRISRNRLEIMTTTIFAPFGIAACWKVTELFTATDIIQDSLRQLSSIMPTCAKGSHFVFLGNKKYYYGLRLHNIHVFISQEQTV